MSKSTYAAIQARNNSGGRLNPNFLPVIADQYDNGSDNKIFGS